MIPLVEGLIAEGGVARLGQACCEDNNHPKHVVYPSAEAGGTALKLYLFSISLFLYVIPGTDLWWLV